MDGLDAMREVNRALRNLSAARGELQNRLTAATAFRAAISGKAHDFTSDGGGALPGIPAEVVRARRHELESSLQTLQALDESVAEARRALARAERAWRAERQVRNGSPRKGA